MNNINFNVSNTSHSSSISLIDEVSNNNISFFISDTALYSKDIKDIQLDSLVTAYDLDNKAILEATTYSNSLLLGVNTLNETDIQTEANIELISEDRNRIAVKSNDELIAQITAIKVIDEAFNTLKPEKPSDMGKIMGFVTPKLKGKADMSFVSKTIKEKLANL
jgi:Glu-tRNA(Gln) amidotransferase subunit E-like FAD-binding protein